MRISSSCSVARVNASSAPKGSSSSSTLGSIASARAMPTRCFMPPEIWWGYLCSAWVSPTNASAAWVLSRSRSLNTLSTARCTFWKHVSHGRSEWFWNTTPRSGPGPSTCLPASRMAPRVGLIRPATRLRSVLLPQPEWPMSVTNSPLRMVRSIPVRISEAPNDMPTASTLRYLSIAEAPGDQHQPLLQQQADDADGEDRDHDVLDLEVVPLVPHPEADAYAPGQHLGGDDHQPGDADGEAHAGDHVGQHGWEQDLGEHLPLGEVQHARDVQVVLRDLAHADRGIHDHRPQAADEDHPDRRRVGRLEDQQADRQPGERRHRLEQRDDRVRHGRQEAKPADGEAERDADRRREAEADADALEGREHVPADALVVWSLAVEGVGEDLRRRVADRQRVGNAPAELRDSRPGDDEQADPGRPRDQGDEPLRSIFLNNNNRDLAPRGRMRRTCRQRFPQGNGAHHATLILKVLAYRFASLPSHTTPSISFAVRNASFGSGVLVAAAACL